LDVIGYAETGIAGTVERMKPALIVIVGATATGKSDLALEVAARLNGPILSADSRQVYQEFDIGTAKPALADRTKVPHYLIDICPPTSTLTVAEYQQSAQTLIAEFHERGISPVLVGGTGLYIQSIVKGLRIPRVPPQRELRSQLDTIPQSERHQWLQQVDPPSAAKIHQNDRIRTLRALEVYYATGKPLSALQGNDPPPYPILQIGLDLEDKAIQTRLIQHRTQQMLQQGWLNEVTQLMEKYGSNLPLLQTLGYAELKAHLMGKDSLETAVELTVIHTRQFAKRQRTWFRADPTIQWFDAVDSHLVSNVWEAIQAFSVQTSLETPSRKSPKDDCALLK
jgi:tRNA dimethylallyltransferase